MHMSCAVTYNGKEVLWMRQQFCGEIQVASTQPGCQTYGQTDCRQRYPWAIEI